MPREKISYVHPIQKQWVEKLKGILTDFPRCLLLLVVDYTREDWGVYPPEKEVKEISRPGCSVGLCGIAALDDEAKFWKEQIKYNYVINEWTQLPNKTARKYYYLDDCQSDPNFTLNNLKGKIDEGNTVILHFTLSLICHSRRQSRLARESCARRQKMLERRVSEKRRCEKVAFNKLLK